MSKNFNDISGNFKKLFTLRKPRSSIVIEFMTDDLPDEWLIDVFRYRAKSGEIVETFLITKEDLDSWIRTYKKDGYEILTKP